MNKMSTYIVLAGIAALGACASDEAVMNDDDMATVQSAAAPVAAMPGAATQDEDSFTAESAPEPAVVAATSETSSASYGSGNLVSACLYGDQKRIISVVYDNETSGNVCEVTYEKSTGVQTLWSAQNDRDYCLDKALAFVEKQKSWGWTCSDFQ
jgi:hypothetical protein